MNENYTPEEVKAICEEKLAEHYHGSITLFFSGSGIPVIEYYKKEKKPMREQPERNPSNGL